MAWKDDDTVVGGGVMDAFFKNTEAGPAWTCSVCRCIYLGVICLECNREGSADLPLRRGPQVEMTTDDIQRIESLNRAGA